jgi:hypothetical protein
LKEQPKKAGELLTGDIRTRKPEAPKKEQLFSSFEL